MFSKLKLRHTKPNQLRDKYAFMHRHFLAKRTTDIYYELHSGEFDVLLCAYSYSSFTHDILKLACRSQKTYILEQLVNRGMITKLRKKGKLDVYVLTRKGRTAIESYYEMLLGKEDFEIHLISEDD